MEQNIVIKKMVDYIETHLDEELSLNKIAKHLNYSKYYIARTFSEKTGITVYKYIQGRRLTIAAYKLVETDKPIIDIAYEAQYSSQQAFTLAFNHFYSCTPQVYRKNRNFSPKQSRIILKSISFYFSHTSYMMGGKIAA